MSDEKNIKQLENSSVSLTLTLPASKIEEDYKKALDKYAKSVQLKGFRKGHVPVAVLESKFGPSLRAESTFDTMEEYLKGEIDKLDAKDKPLPYSTPVLQDEEKLMPFKPNQDITFSVVYDVLPVFDLPKYTGISVTIPQVTVGDDDVLKELDKLREQNAMVIDKKGPSANGDIVNIDYVELDADGAEVPSSSRKDFTFTLGSGYNYYEMDKEVEGMNAGDVKSFEKTYPQDFKTSDLAGMTIKLKVTMKSVKQKEVPVLDDEFAQDVKEEYKSVDDLKKATREKLEAQLKEKLDNEKFGKLEDEIAKGATIALPESMIEFELDRDWKNYVKQTGLSEEQITKFLVMQKQGKVDIMKSWRPEAEKTLKVQLIMEQIKEKENFTVSKEDLDKACDEQLKDVTDAAQKDYYRTMIEDDMKFGKVSQFLESNNKFVQGDTINFNDYMNDIRPEEMKDEVESDTKDEEKK